MSIALKRNLAKLEIFREHKGLSTLIANAWLVHFALFVMYLLGSYFISTNEIRAYDVNFNPIPEFTEYGTLGYCYLYALAVFLLACLTVTPNKDFEIKMAAPLITSFLLLFFGVGEVFVYDMIIETTTPIQTLSDSSSFTILNDFHTWGVNLILMMALLILAISSLGRKIELLKHSFPKDLALSVISVFIAFHLFNTTSHTDILKNDTNTVQITINEYDFTIDLGVYHKSNNSLAFELLLHAYSGNAFHNYYAALNQLIDDNPVGKEKEIISIISNVSMTGYVKLEDNIFRLANASKSVQGLEGTSIAITKVLYPYMKPSKTSQFFEHALSQNYQAAVDYYVERILNEDMKNIDGDVNKKHIGTEDIEMVVGLILSEELASIDLSSINSTQKRKLVINLVEYRSQENRKEQAIFNKKERGSHLSLTDNEFDLLLEIFPLGK